MALAGYVGVYVRRVFALVGVWRAECRLSSLHCQAQVLPRIKGPAAMGNSREMQVKHD